MSVWFAYHCNIMFRSQISCGQHYWLFSAYWDRLVTTRFKKCMIFRAFRYQIHQYWSRFSHGPMALKFYLVVCLPLLVLSLIPDSKAIGNADGTGSNGSFIPTRNEQVSVPINIIVVLWTFYLRFKVWLRYWGRKMWTDTKLLYQPWKYCQVKIRFAFWVTTFL